MLANLRSKLKVALAVRESEKTKLKAALLTVERNFGPVSESNSPNETEKRKKEDQEIRKFHELLYREACNDTRVAAQQILTIGILSLLTFTGGFSYMVNPKVEHIAKENAEFLIFLAGITYLAFMVTTIYITFQCWHASIRKEILENLLGVPNIYCGDRSAMVVFFGSALFVVEFFFTLIFIFAKY